MALAGVLRGLPELCDTLRVLCLGPPTDLQYEEEEGTAAAGVAAAGAAPVPAAPMDHMEAVMQQQQQQQAQQQQQDMPGVGAEAEPGLRGGAVLQPERVGLDRVGAACSPAGMEKTVSSQNGAGQQQQEQQQQLHAGPSAGHAAVPGGQRQQQQQQPSQGAPAGGSPHAAPLQGGCTAGAGLDLAGRSLNRGVGVECESQGSPQGAMGGAAGQAVAVAPTTSRCCSCRWALSDPQLGELCQALAALGKLEVRYQFTVDRVLRGLCGRGCAMPWRSLANLGCITVLCDDARGAIRALQRGCSWKGTSCERLRCRAVTYNLPLPFGMACAIAGQSCSNGLRLAAMGGSPVVQRPGTVSNPCIHTQ